MVCFSVAKLTLRAGSFPCFDCPVVQNGVAEAIAMPRMDGAARQTFADPLVVPGFDAIPEVMVLMSTMSSTNPPLPLWNNLDGYIRDMTILAYQSTWNAMTDIFQARDGAVAEVFPPEYMIKIQLEPVWFIAWLSVLFTGVVAGLLLICVSLNYDAAAAVRDPALAALRLDPSNGLDHVPSLCAATELSASDKKVVIRFARGNNPDEDSHGHDMTSLCQFRLLEAQGGNDEDQMLLDDLDSRTR